MRRESLIGIVSSYDIRWKEDTGYALVITNERIVCSTRPDFEDGFWAFFPPGKEPDRIQIQEAEKKATEIISRKVFEIQKDRLVKIIYDPPNRVFGGRMLLVTVGRRFDIGISVLSPWNPGIFRTVETLIGAVFSFAPQVVYDEKTGVRLVDEQESHPQIMNPLT